jgi:hypothetical protein
MQTISNQDRIVPLRLAGVISCVRNESKDEKRWLSKRGLEVGGQIKHVTGHKHLQVGALDF